MKKNKKKSNQKRQIKEISQNAKGYGKKNTDDEEELDSDLNLQYMNQELHHNANRHKLSIAYFHIIVWFIILYILWIVDIICRVGVGSLNYNPSVINVFLGTTSIHIIGLGYIVMHWLFPNVNKDS